MYIGKVSMLSGASRKAIRHYEELGLLPDIGRLGNYRVYNQHHIVIVSMIKRAQTLGFKLAEIAPLLVSKHQENRFPLEIANQMIEEMRAKIKLEIHQAKQRDKELELLKSELYNLFSDSS